MKKNILIVGAGFSGAVVAEQLSKLTSCSITIIDERSHLGGNCYTERDSATGVMVHTYGPHIFNTNNTKVWNYVSQFCELIPYTNRVKVVSDNQIYSFPINLHTINQFFGHTFNPTQAQLYIESLRDTNITSPQNFEEQALAFVGKELYQAFFYGYTKKQWGCEPSLLPASILKRLPVRFNYNDNYYATSLQGIPKDGYTAIFEKMLCHKNIAIALNTKFDSSFDTSGYTHIVYTGPIDAFFGYKYGRLGYRTVFFERNQVKGDYQGNAVINYADSNVPYTRVHEHKHFAPWEQHDSSVFFKEFSKETTPSDIPFYPKRLANDLFILEQYVKEVKQLKNFTFLGRLATYRYMDMHHVIEEALAVVPHIINTIV